MSAENDGLPMLSLNLCYNREYACPPMDLYGGS